ncbi:uncharacterized protein A4U43_C05F4210 [Asparagus officinalis]|uniref:Profilin n=1 Tax=Asparagus officinalis TaxID=4686 RepID=A0A5P1EP93_ASPOF|nr:uncharacterized protein A4U43_C05F4210 [Asparagus officinalis]
MSGEKSAILKECLSTHGNSVDPHSDTYTYPVTQTHDYCRDRVAWLMRGKDQFVDSVAENLLDRLEGSGGVTIKKTNLALIFDIYDEPITPGQCNMIVERLGDYLNEQGF